MKVATLGKLQIRNGFEHAVYKDDRQPTGYCWYCPAEDWRSPAANPNHEGFWIQFCPVCGLGVIANLLPGANP